MQEEKLDRGVAHVPAGELVGNPSSVPPPPGMPEIQRFVETAQKYGIEVPPPPGQ